MLRKTVAPAAGLAAAPAAGLATAPAAGLAAAPAAGLAAAPAAGHAAAIATAAPAPAAATPAAAAPAPAAAAPGNLIIIKNLVDRCELNKLRAIVQANRGDGRLQVKTELQTMVDSRRLPGGVAAPKKNMGVQGMQLLHQRILV